MPHHRRKGPALDAGRLDVTRPPTNKSSLSMIDVDISSYFYHVSILDRFDYYVGDGIVEMGRMIRANSASHARQHCQYTGWGVQKDWADTHVPQHPKLVITAALSHSCRQAECNKPRQTLPVRAESFVLPAPALGTIAKNTTHSPPPSILVLSASATILRSDK